MKSLKIPLTVSQAKAIVWLILGTVWCLYVTSTIYSYAHQGTVISTYYDTETGAFHLPPIVIFVQGNSPTAPNIGFNWVGDTTNYATTVSVSPGGSTDPLKSVFEVSTLIKPCTRAPTINCTFVQLDPTDITLSIQASIFGNDSGPIAESLGDDLTSVTLRISIH
ncbi:uncharacterized protein EV422DRAFT_161410 [Fimicolochytrium jonesii]|uniref:uncharacterized protein n=1 Tax=Fimicolochytrium jonesii TaxID=1396493 RepID=UPI0022FE6F64|nr:uncharacterized protein EV422DRAFT_161410 [Fimicolochytrium jonesii]KAI8826301.1 hypothetical protein EV422DRAFT_161410 [Fimicolochytrium jonesii]